MITRLWAEIWPNTITPSVWTILAVVVSHIKTHRKLRQQHEDMKQHVSQEASR